MLYVFLFNSMICFESGQLPSWLGRELEAGMEVGGEGGSREKNRGRKRRIVMEWEDKG